MRPRLRPKLNYANVVATVAVFIALGGTSYAAVKIDGSNVKDGSLTGLDVKDRSLTGRDIKDRTIGARDLKRKLLARSGTRGATGPKGDPGSQGPAGPRGPAFATFAEGPRSTLVERDFVTVAMIELESGSWTLSASSLIRNETQLSTTSECALFSAEPREGGGFRFLDVHGETGNLPLAPTTGTVTQDAESLSIDSAIEVEKPIQIHFMCRAGNGTVSLRNPTVTAVQVAEVTDQSNRSGV